MRISPGPLTECRVCGSKELQPFFDLGTQPLANSLLDSAAQPEESFPLALTQCGACALIQLTYTVPPEKLFSEYVWVTGTSSTAHTYAEVFCDRLLARSSTTKGYVLEIASNDGTFLRPFITKGNEVLGIDPARNIADMAEKSGIPTRAVFWGEAEAEKLRKEKGSAAILFARNVLPHVNDQRDFMRGCRIILEDDGVLAIEAHDAVTILNELHYDSIYHEHMCYFTFSTLERLLNDAGFFIFDLEQSPISGGSMVVYAHTRKGEERAAVTARRTKEEVEQSNSTETWKSFAQASITHKDAFAALIKEAKSRGEKVVGYGASARSSTLLNFAAIGPDLITVIADKNPIKQNKYTAGTHIKILSPEQVLEGKPDTVVLLAWNFTDEIQKYLASLGYSGSYILPLPGSSRREK